MPLRVNNLIGFGAGRRLTPTAEFLSEDTELVGGTVVTWSDVGLGAAHGGRMIIVGIVNKAGSTPRTISTVTVGGVSAVIGDDKTHDIGSLTNGAGIVAAFVPTGIIGDIVITFSGSVDQSAIAVWRALNVLSTTATDSHTNSLSDYTSSEVTIQKDGLCFGIRMTRSSTAGVARTHTWTGLTEDVDTQIGTARLSYSAAGGTDTFPAEVTPAITITPNNGTTIRANCIVSYR